MLLKTFWELENFIRIISVKGKTFFEHALNLTVKEYDFITEKEFAFLKDRFVSRIFL